MKNIEKIIFITLLIISMIVIIFSGFEVEATYKTIDELEADIALINNMKNALKNKVESLEKELQEAKDLKEVLSDANYIGEFEITYYTAGPESTGKTPSHPEYGITRNGTTVEEGRTIAADINILPFGTKVWIENVGLRVVEDTGSAIKENKLDVYVEDLKTALQNGRHKAKIYIVEWGGEN